MRWWWVMICNDGSWSKGLFSKKWWTSPTKTSRVSSWLLPDAGNYSIFLDLIHSEFGICWLVSSIIKWSVLWWLVLWPHGPTAQIQGDEGEVVTMGVPTRQMENFSGILFRIYLSPVISKFPTLCFGLARGKPWFLHNSLIWQWSNHMTSRRCKMHYAIGYAGYAGRNRRVLF